MKKFVQSKGGYNPADELGTTLQSLRQVQRIVEVTQPIKNWVTLIVMLRVDDAAHS